MGNIIILDDKNINQIDQLNIKKDSWIILELSSVFFQEVEIEVSEEDLEEHIQRNFKEYISLVEGDYIMNYISSKISDEKQKVIIGAIDKSVLEKVESNLKVKINGFIPSISKDLIYSSHQDVWVLKINEETTRISIFKSSKLLLSSLIPFGNKNMDIELFKEEIEGYENYYTSLNFGKSVQNVLVEGQEESIFEYFSSKGMTILEEAISWEDVIKKGEFINFKTAKMIKFEKEMLKERAQMKKIMILAVIIFLPLMFFSIDNLMKTNTLNQVDQIYTEVEDLKLQNEKVEKKLEYLKSKSNRIDSKKVKISYLFEKIDSLKSQTNIVTERYFENEDKNFKIEIAGRVSKLEDLNEFLKKLKEIDLFSKIDIVTLESQSEYFYYKLSLSGGDGSEV